MKFNKRKLNHDLVLELLEDRTTPINELAKKYGISSNHLHSIYKGTHWKKVPRKYSVKEYMRPNSCVKLNKDIVTAIKSGERTDYKEIAQEYGIRLKYINSLLNPNYFNSWKQIPLKGYENYKTIVKRNTRLTEEQVIEIYTNKTLSNTKLGKKYGVARSTIGDIRRGENWKHVTSKIQLDSAS